jgi:tRNA dimethylallyltransferase
MGATASGKTDLIININKYFSTDIISVDSAQVFREMNIGTAKPEAEILAQAPHRLIDICEPTETYSAAQFRHDALIEMAIIVTSNQIPLLDGGTGLYFRSLQYGLSDLPSANPEIRQQILVDAEKHGWQFLHDKLCKLDPIAGKRIHQNDKQRVQRALEVCIISGKSMSELIAKKNSNPIPYRIIKLIIAPNNRALLHERIKKRFHLMLEQGFIDEVKKLYARGDLNLDMPSMRAVGYRQVWQYLTGQLSYDEMVEKAIIATRQLAKRQLTWLRTEKDAIWFDSLDKNILNNIIRLLENRLN